jgi:hypothetical protein
MDTSAHISRRAGTCLYSRFDPRIPAGLPDIPARIVMAVVNSFCEQARTSVPEREMCDRVRLFRDITGLDDQFQGLDQ